VPAPNPPEVSAEGGSIPIGAGVLAFEWWRDDGNVIISLGSPFNRSGHHILWIKAKFRDSLRSKSDVGQMNEVLGKVICHNLCVLIACIHEIGLSVPEFAA
jgi:hypothetical protein